MRTGINLERIVTIDISVNERDAILLLFGGDLLDAGCCRLTSLVMMEYRTENSFVGHGRRTEDDAG